MLDSGGKTTSTFVAAPVLTPPRGVFQGLAHYESAACRPAGFRRLAFLPVFPPPTVDASHATENAAAIRQTRQSRKPLLGRRPRTRRRHVRPRTTLEGKGTARQGRPISLSY